MEWVNSITSFFTGGSAASGGIIHALIGLAILIIGLFVVKIIVGIIGRMLKKASFLNRKDSSGKTMNLVKPIKSLIKAILTIFVLMAVLQHFGLTDVLEPLKELANKFLSVIPNIIGAGIIGYVGWILAKVISEMVGVGLGPVDRKLAEKTGNSDFKLSGIATPFVFAIILLPIAVAALGVLNIESISGPASEMLNKLMAALPNVIGAAIILGVTYFVAKFVIMLISALLDGLQFNTLPAKIGMRGIFSPNFTPTDLVGGAIMFFAMVSAATAAVNLLGISTISTIFAKVLEFGGGILVGGVILIIGNWLGTMAHDKLLATSGPGMANIARIAILGLVLAMGLRAMGLADNIVNMAFGFTIGAVAVAVALAFGFGGRDAAKKLSDQWASRIK